MNPFLYRLLVRFKSGDSNTSRFREGDKQDLDRFVARTRAYAGTLSMEIWELDAEWKATLVSFAQVSEPDVAEEPRETKTARRPSFRSRPSALAA